MQASVNSDSEEFVATKIQVRSNERARIGGIEKIGLLEQSMRSFP